MNFVIKINGSLGNFYNLVLDITYDHTTNPNSVISIAINDKLCFSLWFEMMIPHSSVYSLFCTGYFHC